ncbi:MAG: glycerol-3-phosphate acyltransferase, partial [Lactobacillus sp.]|nr:glycerol-3-phosphate acyltransferase [Lactobacillus sp.]
MEIALLVILSYLIGSFPSGVIIGRIFFHKDIRNYGSGNIG